MRLFIRLVIIAALAGMGWVILAVMPSFHHTGISEFWKLTLCFIGMIFIALVAGVVFIFWLLPSVGEWIGNLFFNPNQEIEKGPHDDAHACMAQGDFEEAVKEYQAAYGRDPSDTLALSEIARIYCEKIPDFDRAAAGLEQALEYEWPPDQAAFLASRLVDVYWNYLHDPVRARKILVQIAESMPETRHAANALHRLHEIDRALEEGTVPPPATETAAHEPTTGELPQPPAAEGNPPAEQQPAAE